MQMHTIVLDFYFFEKFYCSIKIKRHILLKKNTPQIMFHKEAFPLPLPPAPAESVKTKTPPISGFQRPYFSKTVGKK